MPSSIRQVLPNLPHGCTRSAQHRKTGHELLVHLEDGCSPEVKGVLIGHVKANADQRLSLTATLPTRQQARRYQPMMSFQDRVRVHADAEDGDMVILLRLKLRQPQDVD